MKIAYVSDVIYPFVKGGAEKRIYELSRRLVQRGHEVHIFGIKWWNGEKVIERDGVIIHGICDPMQLYMGVRRSIKEAIVFGLYLLPHLIRSRFDIIDCSEFPYFPCFVAKIASIIRRVPLVITWYEVWMDYWYKYLGRAGIIGKIVEKAASILTNRNIAVSNQTKSDLTSLGVKPGSVYVVPLGIDLRRIRSVPPNKDNFDMLYVGRLIKEKNVAVLLRAAAILKEQFPTLRIGVIGDGPERETLEELVQSLHVEENVKFFGFLEDSDEVMSLMKSSKMVINLSTREGGGSLVALESNACGLPLIAVRNKMGISDELVKDGLNGFFLEHLSEENLAQKVQLLLSNNILRDFIRKNAEDFSKHYDWEQITSLLEERYHRI